MNGVKSLLQELQDAASRGTSASCDKALSHATDLLLAGRYSDEQIWVFGEIIEKLARELEVAARARLATRLAPGRNVPINVVNMLALDDSIEVAGPVIRQSRQLDTRTLVAIARSKSQQHLLAMSQRKSLCEEVTDVLVARGNREVINSVTANPGARLSHSSIMNLIRRSENDSILVENLGGRTDIPRHLFQQLIAKASEDVKKRLASERPEMVDQVNSLVADAASNMHSKFGPASKQHFAAKKIVLAQHQYGGLKEKHIFNYAASHKFEEAVIALSLLCSLPANVVERAVTDKNGETLLILAKALRFSWDTAMALLFLGAQGHKISSEHLDGLRKDFDQLNADTARRVLNSFQARKEGADSEQRRLPQLHSR